MRRSRAGGGSPKKPASTSNKRMRRIRRIGVEMVDFAGSHVVVTGGTGALGRAVIGALRAANAVCHVPNLIAAELDGFPFAADPGVQIARGIDLADEAAVKRFYGALPPLWASIHLAGGFAMAPIGGDFGGRFHRAVPHERAVLLLVLGGGGCRVSRAQGARPRWRGRRADRQCFGAPGARAAARRRDDRLHRIQIRGRRADPGAGAGADRRSRSGSMPSPLRSSTRRPTGRQCRTPTTAAGSRPPTSRK